MEDYKIFRVSGAGNIKIQTTPTSWCGDQYGFGVICSWSKYPESGGVLGLVQARKLAKHILSECDKIEKSEAELISETRINMFK